MTPPASVIIPTRRRPASLRAVLGALACQNSPAGSFEVIVVCDEPQDPGFAVAEGEWHGLAVRVAEQARRGPAAARNLGLQLARGELVIFLDDDVVPRPGFVAAHVKAHQDAQDLAVFGPLLPPPGWGSPWVRFEGRSLERQYRAMVAGEWEPGPRQFYTGNASVLRSHLRRCGGFDERFRRAEDVELAFRLRDLGLRFLFEPRAAVLHRASRTYRSWLEGAHLYGLADVLMARGLGRRGVLESACREFHWRHPLTRAMVSLALAVPPAGRFAELLAWPLSLVASAVGAEGAAEQVLGGAFNLAYWRGMAEGLGGAAHVRAQLRTHADEAAGMVRVAREATASEAVGGPGP